MKRLAVFVSALLLLLGAPAPARADAIEWNMAPCVQPYFGEVNWDPDGLLVLDGVVIQCGPTVENGGFRLATYYPDEKVGFAEGYNVRLFSGRAEGTVRQFGAAAVPSLPGVFGVCFLAGDNERVLCVAATVTFRGFRIPTVTLAPLPTDAPLVDRDVELGTYDGRVSPPPGKPGGPVGNCGTCF